LPLCPTAASEEAVRHAHAQRYCRKGAILIIRNDGSEVVIVPTRCKMWTCPYCGPKLRDAWAERIAVARPKRFLTLTCDPSRFGNPPAAYDAMKAALPKLVALLRKSIGPFEYCAVWELHQSGWPHLHLAQRGVYIPQKFLRLAWTNLGIGSVVDIRAIHTIRGAARYVSKYITKTITEGKAALGITRVIQASKHFFQDHLLHNSTALHADSNIVYTGAHLPAVLDYLIRVKGYRWAADRPGYAYVLTPTDRTNALLTTDEILTLDHY